MAESLQANGNVDFKVTTMLKPMASTVYISNLLDRASSSMLLISLIRSCRQPSIFCKALNVVRLLYLFHQYAKH